jgi:hypothetical protein
MKNKGEGSNKIQYFQDNEGNRAPAAIISDDKGHAQGGWEILSGDNSCVEDLYYGFTIIEAPTTLNILGLTNKYKLNGAVIPSSTNVASYFMEGVYQPCVFNKLSIDSGIVIVYKK